MLGAGCWWRGGGRWAEEEEKERITLELFCMDVDVGDGALTELVMILNTALSRRVGAVVISIIINNTYTHYPVFAHTRACLNSLNTATGHSDSVFRGSKLDTHRVRLEDLEASIPAI